MDDRLLSELRAWLEFYRDLGVEDFYLRAPEEASADRTRESERASFLSKEAPVCTGAEAPSSAHARTGKTAAAFPASGAAVASTRRMTVPATARSLSLFEAPPARRGPETLEQIRHDLGDCQRCRLAAGRKTIVFGEGDPHARLVFVGEAPGADEDEQGLPFVGRAGQLLNRMIQLIGLKRTQVYICNIIKCRPPGNRTPERDEIETCSSFLFRQLEAINPRLICCLGAPAVRTILGIREGITKIRGRFYDYGSAKVLVTVHPAYILRNPRDEKILREDFEKIRDFLS